MATMFFPTRRGLRLATYLEVLDDWVEQGRQVGSSTALAASAEVDPGQFRRDIAWLGKKAGERLGLQGIGYDLPRLREALCGELRVGQPRTVTVVGTGPEGILIRSEIQENPYFRLAGEDEPSNFVVMAGAGPFPQLPDGGLVLHWSGLPIPEREEMVVQMRVSLTRLLLALSGMTD